MFQICQDRISDHHHLPLLEVLLVVILPDWVSRLLHQVDLVERVDLVEWVDLVERVDLVEWVDMQRVAREDMVICLVQL